MFLARDSNLGPKDALNRLLRAGARLATQPWVDNHWTLILWKLAGLVFLDPEQEGTKQPRWSWEEVYRQLLYRYERELSGGVRPPLRRIVNQDTPASCPMILCVSDITWSRHGTEVELRPELEVTDGWYRLRAEIDLPLERAVRRGLIRVGRKLAIVGARLSCERKDGMEILEAYTSVKLGLSGNSTRLAPWHAKLGFQSSFGMVTMRSLTPDGGLVPVMDLVVQKVYPIAYLEIIIDEEGRRIQEGPRSEADEARCVDIWKQTREAEESRLRLEHEKKITRYLGYADRLEHRCGDRFATDEPPDNIESLYDELEEPEDAGRAISRTSLNEAGWLARYIRTRIERDGESARDEIEKELENICPPRNIRSFRVIVVQDARTERFPANRKAQLTIWDVLHVHLTESRSPGHFEVSNLVPSQKSAWMKHKPDSEIFLVSSKNSRWQKVAANVS
ncbi:hypothetical protein K435DRAFT_643336 [Dendrothele bispora CBS 962.96]|uniref:BRCA2 OB1 domain-containing protein n=1 Tax=Dendrothele bispora (strain CBS 962.96) TaxID=1314807 RepID=A0A4S8MXM8_DENBC|nr:hypothetical protein K435DRAFT_643336 [Dendrothele bispora CBS 962.96]